MLGSGASRGFAKKISRSLLGAIIGALLAVDPAPADAQTVPPPSDSALCAQDFAVGAFACGGLSSAVGASATAVGERAAAGGTPSNNFANARTTAFGAGALAGATGPGRATQLPSGRTLRQMAERPAHLARALRPILWGLPRLAGQPALTRRTRAHLASSHRPGPLRPRSAAVRRPNSMPSQSAPGRRRPSFRQRSAATLKRLC